MRAAEPDSTGTVEVAGFRVGYEVFGGHHLRTVLLLPTWQIAPCRHWRMQIPYLAEHLRVVAWDPPGIGMGQRTTDPAAFEMDRVVAYGVGVLDHLEIPRAAIIGLSLGGSFGLWMAAAHPERVEAAVLTGSVDPAWAYGADPTFWEERTAHEGWQMRNAAFWRAHYDEWLEFFFAQVCSEPHSTKATEDFIDWAHGTTPEALIAGVINPGLFPQMSEDEALRAIRCPVLLMHGDGDRIADIATSRRWAAARPDWTFVTLRGSGHGPHLRDPVRVNRLIGDFLRVPHPPPAAVTAAPARTRRRVLYVSSPIGLGHVHRDLAIAAELRRAVPDLEIDWLAQEPVARVLHDHGEHVHPAGARLRSEAAHWEEHATGHRLHAYMAFRDMDEILLANFMVFLDVVRDTPYDLWVGDEAWEVDHHLHENPECKRAPYVFLTDFVGWLPMHDGHEARLVADSNEQMLEQIARFPRVRDAAVYLGDREDLVPHAFGPGLPRIRDWAGAHFHPVGHAGPRGPAAPADVAALRRELGAPEDARVIMASVGGTEAGRDLLGRVCAAWPDIQRRVPGALLLLVCGPRIDPAVVPAPPGAVARGYIPDLHRFLPACDLGIVQGGLSTTMELTLAGVPFLYFPLIDHCEQRIHVRHRLDRHGVGRCLEFADTDAGQLADAAVMELARPRVGRAPRAGAAARAAAILAQLL